MTSTRPADILRHLDVPGADDSALLRSYAFHQDEAAFAEIVRRHGPVVWAACLRGTDSRQDAEDAFQAVFLVLVRRTAAISNPQLLGNWLYGVAVRVAMRARRTAARRRRREVQVATMPDPPAREPEAVYDLGPVIDEELAALPAWYREALVACDLRGLGRGEAARLLGIPEGTLSSRLAAGRKKLAARLARRGVALSVAAIPAALGQAARAAVPCELVARVNKLATDLTVSAAVGRLAGGEYSVKTSLLVCAVFAAAAAGVVYAAQKPDPPKPEDPPKPAVVAKGEPAPAPELKPDPKPGDGPKFTTTPALRTTMDLHLNSVYAVSWSSDGKSMVVLGPSPMPDWKDRRVAVIIHDVADSEKNWKRFVYPVEKTTTLARFAPGSKRVVTDVREYHLVSGRHVLTFSELNPQVVGGVAPVARVPLEETETHGYAFAADGKTFRTVALERAASGAPTKLEIREVGAATGKTLKSLLKRDYAPYELSPDGKRLAVFETPETNVSPLGPVVVYDVDTGKKLSTAKLPEPVAASRPKSADPKEGFFRAFSPDGRLMVISYGIGATVVLNTDTGEALPALEGGELLRTIPGQNAFTGDGRLVALAGNRYTKRPSPVLDGRGQTAYSAAGTFLTVWDTKTGKALRSWDRNATVAFNPVRPLLAVLEPNDEETRLGLWDFAGEAEKK